MFQTRNQLPEQTRKTKRNPGSIRLRLALSALSALAPIGAQAQTGDAWSFGSVVDIASNSRALELGVRDQGPQLGHSDISASGPLGRHLRARLTAAFETHEGRFERGVEEAWMETRTLPWGLSVRAGRFASQIGAMNSQHPHADDFAERPLAYRAFLGNHWTDDGVRVNLTLPTSWYWVIGTEALRGRRLIPEAQTATSGASALTLTSRIGGDIGRAHSWQLGLTYLDNRRTARLEDEHAEGAEEAHDHGGRHAARFGGRQTWWLDATWKWAPSGNNRNEQVRLTLETVRIQDIGPGAPAEQQHQAWSLASVWRFHPNWELGARVDRLRVAIAHEGDYEPGRLSEQTAMLAWKPSHLQTLRLQWSRQNRAQGFESPARQSLMLQYILVFGAHGAHT